MASAPSDGAIGTFGPRSALETANRQVRELLDQLPAGVVVHGPDSQILAANQLACTLLGLSLEQLLGKAAIDAEWHFVREDGSLMPAEEYPVRRALSTRSTLRNQVVGVHQGQDVDLIWVMCNAFPRFDHSGALSEVVVCFTDITELKQAERALHKSEERLRLVLHGSNDAPWDWDLTTDTLYYAPRWWHMLGRLVNELPADSALWQRLMHPDDHQRVSDAFGAWLQDGTRAYEIEFRLLHAAGHYVPVLSRGFILRDGSGQALRVSGTNTDLSDRKEAELRIHRLANFDDLTGLANRRQFLARLQASLDDCAISHMQGALFFVDLDDFKVLNDTLGHDVGDRFLCLVAERLRRFEGPHEYVGRLGGDEFVLVAERLGATATVATGSAHAIANRLMADLRDPFLVDGRNYRSTPSLGITLFDSQTRTIETVLKCADLAMYQAKAAGRNSARFFDPAMQADVDLRVTLESDLREGLQRDEFTLYCQPQLDRDGALLGAEVLVRWQHPLRGMVGPLEFIPLAEATGLILPLGHWILRESCRHQRRWQGHPVLGQIALAVNVSTEQIRDSEFVTQIRQLLDETGANPRMLLIELTESVLARDFDELVARLEALRAMGIGISLDDFGTGYSSLSYLKHLPLRQLKIDRAFVRDLCHDTHALAIAEMIIALAQRLELEVIAEGVEEEEQRRLLLEVGCTGFQGYHLGRPVPIREFERSLGLTSQN
jgi:diguanylate cyclase (GGDEF)-like protein/PAS domain S-box-containing protein